MQLNLGPTAEPAGATRIIQLVQILVGSVEEDSSSSSTLDVDHERRGVDGQVGLI